MLADRRFSFVSTVSGLIAAATMVTLPATTALAAEMTVPTLSYDADLDHAGPPVVEEAASIDTTAAECMAKVVLHEAANQPYDGKVAVAQTLMNRLATGRMGASICEVVNQPGQFFRTAAYNPAADGAGWQAAMQISRAVLRGGADPVVPGAMYFRSAAAPASSFFRSRQRLAAVGQHVFYR